MQSQFMRTVTVFWLAFRLLTGYLWLSFTNRFRSEAGQKQADQRAFGRWGRLFRRISLRMGGVIIKVGQFMSVRADMLPDSFTRELASLQDAVPAAPFPAVKRQVEAELGSPLEAIFLEFAPEPVASASLGQVHRAVLREGHEVAVKVLRPGVERLVEIDLAALRSVMRWVERLTDWGRRFDLQAVIEEFETTTRREMDYLLEAENIRQFRRGLGSVSGVDVPFPFDSLVTRRVLVMEYVAGMKLTDRAQLETAGILPAELAQRLVDAYVHQVLVNGLVHVDPHYGNLLVRPDGTLVLLDFGMVAPITADDRKQVAAMVTSLFTRNLEGVVQALRQLGILRPHADAEVLKQALAFLLDQLSGTKLSPGPEFDRFLVQFREWLYEEPLQFPVRFLFLGRAVGLLAGVALGLDPDLDWVSLLKERALPLLSSQEKQEDGEAKAEEGFSWQRLLTDLLGPRVAAAAGVAGKELAATGMSLLRVPGQLEQVLRKAEVGSLRVQVDLGPAADQLARNGSRSAWAVVAAGAGITGALLRVGGYATDARVAWGIGVAALLLLLWQGRSGGRGRRKSFHARVRSERKAS